MPKKLNGRELMDIKVLYNIPVTTRDGVTLYACLLYTSPSPRDTR